MKPNILVVLLTLGLAPLCWSEDSREKGVPAECKRTIRVHGSFPDGPFKLRTDESYKRSPTIKYLIQENGTVSDVGLTHSSGVGDMDKKILDAVARWKYKPRPAGCGVIETEMTVVFDPPLVGRSSTAVGAPTSWHKVEAGAFSLFAPSGWEFHQLPGVDSYVGEFVGEGVVLTFDFGGYSSSLKEAKEPTYVIAHESIGGLPARIVSPSTPGHGITGIYFRNVGRSNALCLWGQNLTSTQQELVLKMFETIRFGRNEHPAAILPPTPANNVQ